MRKEFGKPMATFGQEKDLPNFKATRSLPSPFLRWVTIAALALFTGLSVVMLHGSIHLALSEEEDPIAAGVLILLSLAMVVINVALWRYRRYSEITIDETGITYRNASADSVYRSFSWQDLQTNPDPGGCDVERITISGYANGARISSDHFQWWIAKAAGPNPHRETFRGAHTFNFFFSNRHELMAGFLLGLAHFRPDLTVDRRLFTTFHICPLRYRYNPDSHFETKLGAAVGAVFLITVVTLATIVLMKRANAL